MHVDWGSIEEKLQKNLKESRYRHTMGVTYTASALAMRYGCDINQARLAGLLHDCAKGMSGEELKKFCEKNKIEISPLEAENPSLLHAKAGAYLALHVYSVRDREVLSAIRWHTTGRPGMTMLEKIVFTADYIEPNRDKAPRLPELRKLAFQDLDRCIYEILSDTVKYLSANPKTMDRMTSNTLDYYETGRYFG